MSASVCTIDGCERPVHANSLCGTHNQRRREGRDLTAPVKRRARRTVPSHTGATCAVPECDAPKPTGWQGGDYCRLHTDRLTRTGTLRLPSECDEPGCCLGTVGYKPWCQKHSVGRVFVQLRPDSTTIYDGSPCWVPVSYRGDRVKIRTGGVRAYVYRLAWEAFVGPIPDGLTIDHLCRNTRCCNPDHLEPVPMPENTRRNAVHRWSS